MANVIEIHQALSSI